jgi:predicted acylesterase/phospholipase RssA
MAVASQGAAVSALRALINSEPVPARTLLQRPYLPQGMDPAADPVLCDPETLVGGYGDESRYQLPVDDPAAVAGSPASVLSGQPSTRTETVQTYLTSSLDLTMQGGTTSGVVYPLAVCELATQFRFRNVGGASAGAIAAAITAAAELGRSELARRPSTAPADSAPAEPLGDGDVRRGFVGVTDIISWLSQTRPGDREPDEFRLAQLFRPTRRSHNIFRVLVAVMRRQAWTLPLLLLAAFGRASRALAAALLVGAVVLTGWVGGRFTGAVRSGPATLAWGLIGVASFVATVVALLLLGQGLWSWLGGRRARDGGPAWLARLRTVTSAYPAPRRRTVQQLLTGLGLAALVVAAGSWRPWDYLAALVVGLAVSLLLVVVLLVAVLTFVVRFRARSYGLVAGTTARRRRTLLDILAGTPEPTVDRSLVPWLGDCLSALAGLPAGEVLRFGHLWAGQEFASVRAAADPADMARFALMSQRSDERLVNLELMTTDLSRQRPYRFPLQRFELDDPAQLWLCLDALGDGESSVFPKAVMAALGEGRPRTVRDRTGRSLTLHPLPDPWDLPVIFAVRLSMALPALFQAVPLYRIVAGTPVEDDFGRTVLDRGTPLPGADGRAGEVAEELWFSDGGITSNFPVHFFDSPLPRWPTVSLNLGPHPEQEPQQDISLPRDYDPVAVRSKPLTGSGLSLAGAVFTTARSWRDSMQSAMPGYRNRIAQVRTRDNEGGTNLFMPREVIASMALRGALAGARLRTRFADPAQWDRFRWLRLRVAMSNLERLRGTAASRQGFYADMFAGPEWLCVAEQQLTDVPLGEDVPWYEPPVGFWRDAPAMLETFATAYTPDGVNVLTSDLPRPEPALRQVAQE